MKKNVDKKRYATSRIDILSPKINTLGILKFNANELAIRTRSPPQVNANHVLNSGLRVNAAFSGKGIHGIRNGTATEGGTPAKLNIRLSKIHFASRNR